MTAISRKLLFLFSMSLALGVVAEAAGQGTARAAFDQWLERLNDAPVEELNGYVAANFAESFLQQVPLEQIVGVHEQLRGAGAFEIASVESETDGGMVALLRTSSGAWFRAQLSVAGNPPKIDGLLIQPASAPSDEEPRPLEWDTLDELAARIAADADLPGVALAWARLGEEPRIGVAGVRAEGTRDAIEPGDLWHIGSITKSVTASALGGLAEEEQLSWEATLGELLPGMEMNPVYSDATLFLVLRHRARLQQHQTFGDEEMARLTSLPGTPTEQRGAYVAEVLVLEPLDDAFAYSNAGYAIAGFVGERAGGESWEVMVRQQVFEPLGLASCGFGWPATEQRPSQPRGHYGSSGARQVQGLGDYELGAFIDPAGDVHCSVGDLTQYGLAHLSGLSGQDGFLEASTVQELHRLEEGGAPYAAGWGIDPESGQHRHNGSAGTFYSYLVIDPEAQIVVTFFTNVGPGEGQVAATRAVAAILERYGGS